MMVLMFECAHCKRTHTYEADATKCCKPIMIYVCNKCGNSSYWHGGKCKCEDKNKKGVRDDNISEIHDD